MSSKYRCDGSYHLNSARARAVQHNEYDAVV
jgi:hypothetical protein